MKRLLVEILAEGRPIGVARLEPTDSSMGVASAIFEPNEAYSAELHARVSELHELSAPPMALSARSEAGIALKCAGIDLVDFSRTIAEGGREVHVLGLEGFEFYFG